MCFFVVWGQVKTGRTCEALRPLIFNNVSWTVIDDDDGLLVAIIFFLF